MQNVSGQLNIQRGEIFLYDRVTGEVIKNGSIVKEYKEYLLSAYGEEDFYKNILDNN